MLAPGGVAWGILPCRQRHAAIHLRLLDVLSSGIAAHPQRFVVVNHDVSCPTGSLQGGKTKSEVHRHSPVVLGVGQQGQAAYPLQRPDHPLPPESNSAPRQAQLPSALPAPRPPGSTHSPSRGTLCCWHTAVPPASPQLSREGVSAAPCPLPRGLSPGPGGRRENAAR